MALDSYTSLQASIADWLNRQDLAAQIPDFIALAEARFNRDLRVADMLKRYTTVATSDYVALPTDWQSHVSIAVTGDNSVRLPLQYLTNEEWNRVRLQNLTGTFRYYTLQDSNIALLPAMSSGTVSLEIFYYSKIPALSASNPTNWLLQRAPDLYLFTSLMSAEAYLQNDERVQQWAGAMQNVMDSLKAEDERLKRPEGALRTRKRTFG